MPSTFGNDVKARHDKMVGFSPRVMSDKRGTMSAGRGMLGPVETMLKLHEDLPKAKTPHVWANG